MSSNSLIDNESQWNFHRNGTLGRDWGRASMTLRRAGVVWTVLDPQQHDAWEDCAVTVRHGLNPTSNFEFSTYTCLLVFFYSIIINYIFR